MDLLYPDISFENMPKEKNGKKPKVMTYTFYISNYIFGINSIRKKKPFGLV